MSEKHLDPAKSVIAKFGVEKVAEITGKHVSRVYRWMYPSDRGGTGGFIPPKDAQALLRYATEHGIEIAPAEFMVSTATLTAQQFDDLLATSKAPDESCQIEDAGKAAA